MRTFTACTSVLSNDALVADEIHYEAGDLYLSEDGMEDFGWWVVTQGRAFFDALTDGKVPSEQALEQSVAMHMENKSPRRWASGEGRNYRERNFLSPAVEVFEDRFEKWSWEREDRARARAFALRDAEYSAP